MIHFEAICKISNSRATLVRMGNDNYFMATVDELLKVDEHPSRNIRQDILRSITGKCDFQSHLVVGRRSH